MTIPGYRFPHHAPTDTGLPGVSGARAYGSAANSSVRVAFLATALAMAACGGSSTSDVPRAPPATTADALTTVGDVTIRASVLQTSALDVAVARDYGISRDDNIILLLVAVRQGPEAEETAVPARITATVTDLSGRTRSIAMRELRIADADSGPPGSLLDYIGTIDTSLPDTLRFDLTIVRAGGASSTMQFTREFFP